MSDDRLDTRPIFLTVNRENKGGRVEFEIDQIAILMRGFFCKGRGPTIGIVTETFTLT